MQNKKNTKILGINIPLSILWKHSVSLKNTKCPLIGKTCISAPYSVNFFRRTERLQEQ